METKLIIEILNWYTKGTCNDLFTEDQIEAWAKEVTIKGIEDKTLKQIGEILVDDFILYMSEEQGIEVRCCSVCGKLFHVGYCYNMGDKYYCSDDCLHFDFTPEEWTEECETNDQSYYSEWY